MRTLIPWILALSLLTGCSAAAMAEVERPPAATQLTEKTVEEPIIYTVETLLWGDEARAEDGTLLASYTFHLPVLTACRADGSTIQEPQTAAEARALEVTDTFNAKFEQWAAAEEFTEIAAAAEAELAWFREEGRDWPGSATLAAGGYALELTCDVYQTDRFVSVSGTYVSATGGAHPNIWLLGWNFDLETGAFFGPEILAGGGDAVREELLRQSRVTATENGLTPEAYFWEDYADILSDWTSYAVTFDDEAMTVAFSPYELAPYGAGPQVFRIPYRLLRPYLDQHARTVLGVN